MCFGDNKTSAETQSRPAWLTGAASNNLAYANGIRDQGFTPYTNSTVAGFSGQQKDSFGLGSDVASGVAPAVGNTGDWINSYANAGAGSVNPGTIASRMSPYMNSYVQQALAPQLQMQDEQFNRQNKNVDSAATMAGAFGDTGWGQLRGTTTQAQDTARQGLIGQAYNSAFNTAIGAGAQDVSNDVNAQTTNANLRETALGRQLGGANTAFNMGTGATNLTNSLGGQQTAQQQAQLNAQYNEFLRQKYQDPQFRASLGNSALSAATPAAPTTTTKTAPDNSGYGLLGTAVGTIGGAMLGGPAGAAIGGALGKGVSSMFGGATPDIPATDYAGGGPLGYADGGRPPVGHPVMVGERGPEAFVPDQHHHFGGARHGDGGMMPGHPWHGQPGQPGQGNPAGAAPNGFPSALPPGFGLMGGGGLAGMFNPSAMNGGHPNPAPNAQPGGLPSGLANTMHGGFGLMGGNGLMPTVNSGQPTSGAQPGAPSSSYLASMAPLLGGGQAVGQLLSRTNPTALPTAPGGQPGAQPAAPNQPDLASRLASLGGFGAPGFGSARDTANLFAAPNAAPPTQVHPTGGVNTGMSGGGSPPKMPGFAHGGRPPVGKPVMVGEHGPEMVVMDRPGTVVPNEVLAAARKKKKSSAPAGGLAAQLGAAA